MFNSQFDSSRLAGSPQEDFCFCSANNSTEDEVVVRSSRRMLSCGLPSVRLCSAPTWESEGKEIKTEKMAETN